MADETIDDRLTLKRAELTLISAANWNRFVSQESEDVVLRHYGLDALDVRTEDLYCSSINRYGGTEEAVADLHIRESLLIQRIQQHAQSAGCCLVANYKIEPIFTGKAWDGGSCVLLITGRGTGLVYKHLLKGDGGNAK